jgi:hypothetical protein
MENIKFYFLNPENKIAVALAFNQALQRSLNTENGQKIQKESN